MKSLQWAKYGRCQHRATLSAFSDCRNVQVSSVQDFLLYTKMWSKFLPGVPVKLICALKETAVCCSCLHKHMKSRHRDTCREWTVWKQKVLLHNMHMQLEWLAEVKELTEDVRNHPAMRYEPSALIFNHTYPVTVTQWLSALLPPALMAKTDNACSLFSAENNKGWCVQKIRHVEIVYLLFRVFCTTRKTQNELFPLNNCGKCNTDQKLTTCRTWSPRCFFNYRNLCYWWSMDIFNIILKIQFFYHFCYFSNGLYIVLPLS